MAVFLSWCQELFDVVLWIDFSLTLTCSWGDFGTLDGLGASRFLTLVMLWTVWGLWTLGLLWTVQRCPESELVFHYLGVTHA